MKRIFHLQDGFTLIELLAVLVILGIVGSIVVGTLVSSLRGNNKANSINNVKQNGNYAISQVAKMLRNSKRMDVISVNSDGSSPMVNCVATAGAGTPTPTPRQYTYIKATDINGNANEFACKPMVAPTPAKIQINNEDLIDTNMIHVDGCYFTCTQTSTTDYPAISVYMNLSQINTTGFFENTASANFETTVVMRNLISR